MIVEDGGVLVNPMVVDGQIYGGLAQGIGTALYEEMPFDAPASRSRRRSPTICCRGRPKCRRRVSITWRRRRPTPQFGVKGIGEGGAIAPPAAIANAVNDALRPLGVELLQSPITPCRVVEAILAARARRKAGGMKAGAFRL